MDNTQPCSRGLMTIEEFAARAGVSAATVWRLLATGRLHAVRLGRRCTRVRERDLAQVMKATGTLATMAPPGSEPEVAKQAGTDGPTAHDATPVPAAAEDRGGDGGESERRR
ncbi:MAG: helix-turn-helix domain-containing protein [Deltaproteobacteria bacterium]|nr:helix-turn-helix domain-containing protein [Deltaproteobacteria bacterium]